MIFPLLRTIVNTKPIFCYDRNCVVSDDVLISGESKSRIEGGNIKIEWNNETAIIPYNRNPIFDNREVSQYRIGSTTISFPVHVSQDYNPSIFSNICTCVKCTLKRDTKLSPVSGSPVTYDIFLKNEENIDALRERNHLSLESLSIALDIGIEMPAEISEGMLSAINARVLVCSLSS